ncbi:xanthine dehydrogenase family protein molybdopterin-binding subunit [Spirosoma radiotolerans]|uniref:Aldehyde oxidase n=1 Tax=Spirosoma radiotolerans TaxID=1379870 RepID=A0A0E3ZU05_9BACT|nr:molybdopterin cofactor-binding domain-containing protein [Spirosoma radiotolerans]AKD54885.1 aldehyde oxidase [Spirosoma radiotolerans]
MTSQHLSRRAFIRRTTVSGAALWLGLSTEGPSVLIAQTNAVPFSPVNFSPYLQIDSAGMITLFNPKPELGQGTFQSLPALICEELEVPLDQVNIVHANGEKIFGDSQFSAGSMSVKSLYTVLRTVGAAASQMLLTAASQRWAVSIETCYAQHGRVVHRPTGRQLTYGELAGEASRLAVPQTPPLKDPGTFTLIGKSVPRPDVPAKTRGETVFGIDIDLPGMLYASIERCPVIGGKLMNVDASKALEMPGVEGVFPVKRSLGRYDYMGVGVVARSYWAALQARKALMIDWDIQGLNTFTSTEFENTLRALKTQPGLAINPVGDFETTYAQAPRQLEAFYETPMVAHSPMEPMNCVARWSGEQVEIWVSTQVPGALTGSGPSFMVDLPKTLGIPAENITLHTQFCGGGFGRRLYLDFIVEAIELAKLTGKAVKSVWTREDTTQQGPYRPMTFSAMKAGLSTEGKVLAFQHTIIAPSIAESLSSAFDPTKLDGRMSEGVSDQAYEIGAMKNTYVRADTHIPLGSWRSVTSSTTAFAHECFIDELAHQAGKDPLAFRLAMLTKASDTKRMLLKLQDVSDWSKPLPAGRARGVAQWAFFAGLCGQVVEVSRQPDGQIKVDKVVAVIDLGTVVHPDNVKNQVEGAIVMALTAATKPGITFVGGKVVQSNFHDSPVLRMNEMPRIEVHILADGGPMKGVGEPGLPPLAPALGNALFALTGKRLRQLPIDLASMG